MLSCHVFSSQSTIKHDDLRGVVLPALVGQMQVLAGHAEAFILLGQGKIIVEKNTGSKQEIDIKQGGCYIKDDVVNIIL